MDRALWLLLGLRLRAWLRRLRRAAGTVRGALLCAVGLLLFLSWILPALLVGPAEEAHLQEVRQVGPLALIVFCVFNVLLSGGERAISFSPAEVNFLFPAPFSRRQLLLYKIATAFGQAVFSALFLTLVARRHTALFLAGFVGLTLTVFFLQLFSMTLALLASTAGAQAYNRRRRAVLVLVVAVVVAAVLQAGSELRGRNWLEILAEVEQTPVARVVLAPVGWLIQASTAEQLWPDLAEWAGLGLVLDLALLLVVLALDAHYLESAASSSERVYARLQQVRRGGPAVGLPSPGKARLAVPPLPAWGGVGPVAWRQLTTALRSLGALLLLLFIFGMVLMPVVLESGPPHGEMPHGLLVAIMLVGMTLFVPPMLPFDFRADIDRMDLLKTLPLPAWRLVLGQLLTPVLLVTVVQMLIVAGVQVFWGRPEPALLAAAAFLPPINLLLFAIENLFFLWFPTRLTGMGPGDFQLLGRHMLLWMGKLIVLMLIGAVAFGVGAVVALIAGGSWVAGGLVAWVLVAGSAAGLVPLLVLAFNHFDVARDLP